MKDILVSFISKKIKDEYVSLKDNKYEDRQLYEFITRAIDDLKKNSMCG